MSKFKMLSFRASICYGEKNLEKTERCLSEKAKVLLVDFQAVLGLGLPIIVYCYN